MKNLFFKPDNAWVGDLIPYYDKGTYYAFYLHDSRIRENEFAEDTTWHLATTGDCTDFTEQGEAIPRGSDDRPNKNIYTGSVIKNEDGTYTAFYTAYNADITINGKSVQSVMKAHSPDLMNWKTQEDFIFTADDEIYESFDWRDPYVFFNEEEGCYWMLLAARIKGSGYHRGGCTALCKSKDLNHWTYEQPFYAPSMYITMECPEVFQMGDWWYLVFSTFSDKFTTHYRMAKSVNGPWLIPEDDVFDTRANYAIKTASDGKQRFAFGWIASKKGENDFGPWEWGGTMVAHEVVQKGSSGILQMKPAEAMVQYFNREIPIEGRTDYNCSVREEQGEIQITSETLGAALFQVPEGSFELDMDIYKSDASEAGIALHTDPGLENGYFLKLDFREGTVAWDIWPRAEQGMYQWQIKGDIPYQVETMRRLPEAEVYHMKFIREDTVCVVYINDEIALSSRMYNHRGGYAGGFVVGGTVSIHNCHIKIRE